MKKMQHLTEAKIQKMITSGPDNPELFYASAVPRRRSRRRQ